MKVEIITTHTVDTLIERKKKNFLKLNREYQRGLAWSKLQQLMFIDSIFRGYSIPAFYFHKIQESVGSDTNTFYNIVDGQQRIDTIYGYAEGAFPLLDPAEDGFRFPNFVKNTPCPWASKHFNELPESLKKQFKDTPVVVYEISTTDENEIRDLFIRLQGGTPLTPQDKRDAWPGNFTEYVLRIGGKTGVDRWYGVPVFKERISNESRRRQLIAQVFMLFWSIRKENRFCDIKSKNIDQFYHEHVDFDEQATDVKRFDEIGKKLHRVLSGWTKIQGHYLIHLFLLADSLLDDYLPSWENKLGEALDEFDRRFNQASKDANNQITDAEFEKYWSFYAQWTRTNSDIASTIQRRHTFFEKEILALLDLKKRDSNRSFTDLERRQIFRRDKGQCQYCKMMGQDNKVPWSESEIHHVTPYSRGGPTNIVNAALMHKDCHPKSERDVNKFMSYWRDKQSDDNEEEILMPITPRKGKKRELPPDGTKVKFDWKDQLYEGVIKGRRIKLNTHHGEGYTSFTSASRSITNTSRNGWNDWDIQLPGEKDWILANHWRTPSKRKPLLTLSGL